MKLFLTSVLLLCCTFSSTQAAAVVPREDNAELRDFSVQTEDLVISTDADAAAAGQQCQTTLSLATDFVAIGYNLLKGNPDGKFRDGGIDPGLRIAHSVMKFTYDENRQAFYDGESHSVPDQVEFQQVSSCSARESTRLFSGMKSYQNKLDTSVNTEGDGSYGLASYRFSISAGYSQAKSESEESKTVIIDKEVICNVGTARYLLDTALNNHYSISDDFYYAVKNLPTAYDEDIYKSFIDKWGTHFISSVTLGGRRIKRFKSQYKQVYNFSRNEYQSSISAGGSYHGFSGSFEVNLDGMHQSESFTNSYASYQYTTTSGLEIEERNGHYYAAESQTRAPIPIQITLVTIDTALDPRLWTHPPENGTSYTSLQIDHKRQLLRRTLENYPRLVNAQQASDPLIKFPNAWPDGTYSLPKSTSGCPAHGEQFPEWYEGWRYQDTEDTRNTNQFSAGHHLSGSFGRNIRTEWCTKTVSSGDYGISWPKGSYCTGRKNGGCPQGFQSGYIYWDDEDSSNDNDYDDILPDGTYNHNTRIYYCCRDDAHPTDPITLPTDRPFYLMRKHKDGCQQVKNMNVRSEWVFWDDEDGSNSDSESGSYPYRGGSSGYNQKLHYCYYY